MDLHSLSVTFKLSSASVVAILALLLYVLCAAERLEASFRDRKRARESFSALPAFR